MALNDKTINFDINKRNIFNLTAKQYDTNGARSFTFRLIKNSIPFDLTGLSVKVGGTKPDGKSILNNCNIIDASKGIIELELTTQMQVVAGILNLELIILKGETRLSTIPFEVEIIQGATCYSEIQSSDEFRALQDALWKTDNVYDKSEIDNFTWGMSNMGQDVKEAMTGGSVAVVGNDAVDTINLRNNAIKSPKLDNAFSNIVGFLKEDTNLNTIYKEGNYIGINPLNAPINSTFLLHVKTFSGSETEQDYRYVLQQIIDFKNTNNIYTRLIDRKNNDFGEWKYNSPNLKTGDITTDFLKDSSVTIAKLDDYLTYKINNIIPENNEKVKGINCTQNLLNKNTFIQGGLDGKGNVNPKVENNYCSDFIEVESGKRYYRLNKNVALIAYYDENKSFISRPTLENNINFFDVPGNAKFIRYTNLKEKMNTDVISSFKVEKFYPYNPEINFEISEDYSMSLTRSKLSDSFFNTREFIRDLDLNTLKKDGSFVCVNCINAPKEETFFLFNITLKSDNSVRWLIQNAYSLNDGAFYYRTVDTVANKNTPWETTKSKNKYISKLKGKTWVFFGDSITEGVGTKNPSLESYPARIRDKYSINIINKAIAGASWQEDGQYDNICVLTQIKNTDLNNVDFCTIFAGTNDFGRGALPIGNIDDTCTNTLHGAINNAIKMIIEKKQDIKIGIITPMWRQRLSADDNKDSDFNDINGKYLRDYVNAVIESAKYNHVPVLNMYENCGINKYNYNIFLADGLHCNPKGYDEILSEKIYDFGNSIF
ncbi:MAG: GDSL-type esterase/lipase family protein [Clostridium perfringens]